MDEIREKLSGWKTISISSEADAKIRRLLDTELNNHDYLHKRIKRRLNLYRNVAAGLAAVAIMVGVLWSITDNSNWHSTARRQTVVRYGPESVVIAWADALKAGDATKAASYLYLSQGSISKAELISSYKATFKTQQLTSFQIESVQNVSPTKAVVKMKVTHMYVSTSKSNGSTRGDIYEWEETVLKINGRWRIYENLSANATPGQGEKLIKIID